MKRILALGVSALAALLLFLVLLSPSPASASTLTDCLAQQHVCVARDGRSLVSQSQEADLERQIGGDPIYLVVAAPGSAGYDSAMNQIISALNGHPQFTVGFLDSQRKHFGAYNKGMLPSGGAADIATSVVQQHRADQDIFAALTDFVTDVQREASSGSSSGTGSAGAPAGAPSHTLRNVLIVVGVIAVLAGLGIFFIGRPIRRRRQQELKEAKLAAQDDLIALSTRLTDQDTDVAVRSNPEAAQEQAAALSAYERGTAALDAARRVQDMGAVSRAIAEGQYHLASAEALAAGQPRPERRPPCFFDPRHGMSVTDAYWTPPDGGPGRLVPVCSADAHKLEWGIEPEMRQVEVHGTPVNYVNAGFAPAYWGGYGFGPGLFTGFLLGELLSPPVVYADGYPGGGDYGGGDFGGGDGDGGGDFGGGNFGGGDYGGGDFGGGDFGGGGDFS
jgi:uncharacterized membrane protein YgcG